MRDAVKDLLRSTVIGIGIAMAIFCITGVIFDIIYKGNFSMTDYQFNKMVVGCILTGIGFGVPTVIYRNDSLPMPVRVLIHMGIGCVVYTIVAYAVGWIGEARTIWQGILAVAMRLLIAFIIWFLFMRYYRRAYQGKGEQHP